MTAISTVVAAPHASMLTLLVMKEVTVLLGVPILKVVTMQ